METEIETARKLLKEGSSKEFDGFDEEIGELLAAAQAAEVVLKVASEMEGKIHDKDRLKKVIKSLDDSLGAIRKKSGGAILLLKHNAKLA